VNKKKQTKAMNKQGIAHQTTIISSWIKLHKIPLLIIALILIIDLTLTGFLKFGYYVVRCGGVPILVTHTNFWGGSTSYWMPGNYTPGGATARYFCSESEVKSLGIDRNPLQGP
jgi:hypothetical protein